MIKKRKIFDILTRYQNSPEVIVLTGFRRVGKTWTMEHIYNDLPTPNKLFLDLESPVNQKLFQEENYENIKISLANLGLGFNRKAYVFLDEIQNVRILPSVVKYLYDHYQIKFYLTGSSSFYLKNFFSESLAGRKYIFELYPLDFEEFLWFKDQKLNLNADYDFLAGLYQEFLIYGGFPGVVMADSPDQKQLKLDDVLGSYFQIDVKNLAGFRDNDNLKKLLFLLSSRVGSKPEVNKLAETLAVSRNTVYQYLNFLEQTYLIHLLRPFSGSKDIQIRNLPKLYFCDTGLLNRVAQVSQGQLFENKIFNQLFAKMVYSGQGIFTDKLHYYQEKGGTEIDFIADETAYEVKLSGGVFDLRRVKKTAARIGIDQVKVISLNKVANSHEGGIIYPFAL